MSCLFYCIGSHPGPELTKNLVGVGGRPVYQVAHRGLRAAISQVNPADLAPDLPRVRAYARVVQSCHRQGAIIPLRYGCVLPQESEVIQLLDAHGGQYEDLLQELEGCVEMGLRALLASGPWAAAAPGGPAGGREAAGPPPPGAAPSRPGLAYLLARKAHFAQEDRWTQEYRQAAERYLAQFSGLFAKAKTEGPSPRLPLLSLYFLVPHRAVASFRQAFRHLAAAEPARLLLSGPWPPYNFVTIPRPI
jgi:hypothetical protein